MLRDVGVRTKVFAVLAIPTLLLVLVTGLLVAGQVSAARRAGQVAALTDVAIQVNRVVHSLQGERSATLVHLEAPEPGTEARVRAQRAATDAELRRLRELVAESALVDSSPALSAAVRRSAAGHDELRSARASIDAGRFYATETDVFYGKTIRADLDLPGVAAASGDAELASLLQAYQSLSTAIEYTAHERDLVEVALLSGSMNEAEYASASALLAQQRQALQDFQAKAPAEVFAALDNALSRAQNFEIDQVRRDLPELLKGKRPDFGASVEWVGAANSRVSAMTQAESQLVVAVGEQASATQTGQERRAMVLVLVAVIGLGLAGMLAINLARRITRPLRRLTVAAGQIGDELPRMVERMQTPGEGSDVEVEAIPVESRDEIGQLAEAFNSVNDVTVQVAKEQAALRASIAEMFVNVARRNQVLLGRQLKALDQMEAREEDPDVLQRLFTLDHLATRMRRNAESLLVLAGIDSTRRLRAAIPLSDVIRTAVGEIEAYDRIDLSMAGDPQVSGRHALTVAHLLAELIENATHFSNPDTRVVVAAVPSTTGVTVTITDYGLGMSADEIADANARIADPPVTEIAVSQRLGLFVVGRLAKRLGATVELRPGRTAGTTVTVGLPVSVLEGVTVTEPVEAVTPAEPTTEDTEDTVGTEGTVGTVGVAVAAPAEADVTGDSDVTGDADVIGSQPPRQRPAPPPHRHRSLPWRRKPAAPAPAAAEECPDLAELPSEVDSAVAAPEPEPVSAFEPERDPEHGPEPESESSAEPEPELEPGPEPSPVVADETATVEAALQERPPVLPPVFAPSVDILPSGGGRRGRRASLPRRKVAAPAPALAAAPEPVWRPTDPMPATVAPALPTPATPAAPAARPEAPAPAAALASPVTAAATTEPDAGPAPAPAGDLPSGPPAQAPTRAAAAPVPAPAVAAPAHVPVPAPAAPPLEDIAARAELTSTALSELRGLYEPSFTPEVAPVSAPIGLVRRTPKATETVTAPVAAPAGSSPARTRSAAEVRGMLSGFRAGVERGRNPGNPGSPASSEGPDNITAPTSPVPQPEQRNE